jgi:hypothetical protein
MQDVVEWYNCHLSLNQHCQFSTDLRTPTCGVKESWPACMIFGASHCWAKGRLQLLVCMDKRNIVALSICEVRRKDVIAEHNQLAFWN